MEEMEGMKKARCTLHAPPPAGLTATHGTFFSSSSRFFVRLRALFRLLPSRLDVVGQNVREVHYSDRASSAFHSLGLTHFLLHEHILFDDFHFSLCRHPTGLTPPIMFRDWRQTTFNLGLLVVDLATYLEHARAYDLVREHRGISFFGVFSIQLIFGIL